MPAWFCPLLYVLPYRPVIFMGSNMRKPCCKMLCFEVSLKHTSSTYCFVFLKRKIHKPPCLVWLSLLGAAFHRLEIMILFLFNLDSWLKVVEFYETGVWFCMLLKSTGSPKHSIINHEHTQCGTNAGIVHKDTFTCSLSMGSNNSLSKLQHITTLSDGRH